KSQSGPLAQLLGAVKRFKDMLDNFTFHPVAVVGKGHKDISARLAKASGEDEIRIERDRFGCDDDRTTARQGITGIRRQIHQHLLDLAAVDQYRQLFSFKVYFKVYILADQPQQQLMDTVNYFIQVDNNRVRCLLAAEGKQPLGQNCATLGG